MNRHGGHRRSSHADAVVEHSSVDVVGEHEDGVDVAGWAVRHAHTGEGHDLKANRTESVLKHGQRSGRQGIHRDGVCFHGADPETQDIRATETQGCNPVPLRYDVHNEDTICERAIRYVPLDRSHPIERIWLIACYHRASAGFELKVGGSTIEHGLSAGPCL